MKMHSDNAMISVEMNTDMLRMVDKALGGLKSESRKVLKKAINTTAKQAKKDLIDKAREEYTVKAAELNKATEKHNATVSNLEATIEIESATRELTDFKTRVSKQGVKAQILKSSSMKLLQSQRGNRAKAFMTKFESGHQAIVQRQEGQTYKTAKGRQKRMEKYGPHADMTQIKKLLAVSAPKMIGSEKRVFGILRPTIYENLMTNIQKEIDKTLASR